MTKPDPVRQAAEALPPEIDKAIHALTEAHRDAAELTEFASIRQIGAAVVTCDEAYCALVTLIRAALAAPVEDPPTFAEGVEAAYQAAEAEEELDGPMPEEARADFMRSPERSLRAVARATKYGIMARIRALVPAALPVTAAPPPTGRVCDDCFSEIGKGAAHHEKCAYAPAAVPAPRVTREEIEKALEQGAKEAGAAAYYYRHGEDPPPGHPAALTPAVPTPREDAATLWWCPVHEIGGSGGPTAGCPKCAPAPGAAEET